MTEFNLLEGLARLGLLFVPFLFALCFHEFAHGWVAKLKGDRTAELMGRLTMNPIAHMDPIGTFALPIMAIFTGGLLFGWAKPVPVNERNLRNPKNDMFWIALAGPLSNVLLAVVGSFVLVAADRFLVPGDGSKSAIIQLLQSFLLVNLFLAAFNMIPLHPLDGGKVAARFLPESWNRFLEEQQNTLSIILIVFFLAGGFSYLAAPVHGAAIMLLSSMESFMRMLT